MVGARQVGKSTLAREIAQRSGVEVTFFDLEDPRDLARIGDPMLALEKLKGLIIVDEVQRVPGLFSTLRVLADRRPRPARFLVLGSASPELLRQSSESLAGRISYYELSGLTMREVSARKADRLWLRGGFPRAFTARTHGESFAWRSDFIRTFIERDLPQLGINIPAASLYRFWTMLAHYHGQTWNGSEFGRAFGVSHHAIRRYLDALSAALVVRELPAWHENVGKRQLRAPKVYIRDSGLLHVLLGLETLRDVERHPKVGASWEGFALGEIIGRLGADPRECYFWSTHAGAELDLLVVRGRLRLGFEFKRTSSPTLTKSMRSAFEDLGLKQLLVIHAGTQSFALAPGVRAVALGDLAKELKPLAGRTKGI
jgi:hypothetical protein